MDRDRSSRPLRGGLLLAAVACAGALLIGAAAAGGATGAVRISRSLDTGLCGFPVQVTVRTTPQSEQAVTTALQFSFAGPTTVTLRNGKTGRTATLRSTGSYAVDTRTGNISFSGHRLWFWSTGRLVPFLATDGKGSLRAPYFTLSLSGARSTVVDPCALLAPTPSSTAPAASRAPWPLPKRALSQMAYAGLTPIVGILIRHDHVHLDVIVNGKKVTIPAGVGQAEPHDAGPCPPSASKVGDCSPGRFYTALVANSPVHNHSTSGLIHVESDRKETYTLGQFFDEWGVRLSSRCLGGYCAGNGKSLRVYVDGKRAANPRSVVLTDHQEIAVVFGSAADFRSVPTTYTGGWPGTGCGGAGETSCLPTR